MNHPLVQHMMMAQGGLPPGRRAHGFGASPLSPSGAVPIHQMNFLRMAQANMLGGQTGAALGAGHYPYPRQPVPAAAMNMGVAMPAMMPAQGMGMPGMGMGAAPRGGGGAMMSPFGGCSNAAGMMDPYTLALMYGGAGADAGAAGRCAGLGGAGAGAAGPGAAMNPILMDLLDDDDDPDDRGVWDGDDDDLVAAYLKKARKLAPRRQRKRAGGLGPAACMPPGLGGAMPPYMYPIGMGMGVC